MTGLNRSLIEDERSCCKAVTRYISYNQDSSPLLTISNDSIFFPEGDALHSFHYYQENTLYFLNSTNNMNMELELYDFTESEDIDNAMSVNTKRTFNIVVKGLGIPANFTKKINIHPSLQIKTGYDQSTGQLDVPLYGCEIGEEPVPASQITGISTYQVTRETLGISDWEEDTSESYASTKNRAMFTQAKRAWLGRLHGDIIDMAFYCETGE